MKAPAKTIFIATTCTAIAVAPLAHAADNPHPDLHIKVDVTKTLPPQEAEVRPSFIGDDDGACNTLQVATRIAFERGKAWANCQAAQHWNLDKDHPHDPHVPEVVFSLGAVALTAHGQTSLQASVGVTT